MKASDYITIIIVFSTMFEQVALAACTAPTWFAKGVMRNGQDLTVTCTATEAGDELAERSAKRNCDVKAANEAVSNIDSRDLVVSTDNDAATHREVTVSSCVVGLICKDPQVESCESDGEVTIWRKCRYDLSLARTRNPRECEDHNKEVQFTGKDAIANRKDLTSLKKKVVVQDVAKTERSSDFTLSVATVPPCNDLLVKGHQNSRRIKCSQNPMPITIKPTDEEVIVRAKGHLPKSIILDAKGKESHVEVFLDVAD